jgi:hypothetical protein
MWDEIDGTVVPSVNAPRLLDRSGAWAGHWCMQGHAVEA